jgi:carbamoyltransferase
MNILGIHSGLNNGEHDVGAALICDGRIVAVCEEERFSKIKMAKGLLPIRAVRSCLEQGGIGMENVDLVVSPQKSKPQYAERIADFLRHYFGHAPKVELINHQMAHLASAFFVSGMDEAMVISWDHSGDGLSTAIARGNRDGLKLLETRANSNSLGLFFRMITQFLGFKANEGEYKVMGLAPYGEPKYDLSNVIRTDASEGFLLDQSYFRQTPLLVNGDEPNYSAKLTQLLGEPRRTGEEVTQRHRDIAASAQLALEECVLSLVESTHRKSGLHTLCLAGGVALNCSANMRIAQLPYLRRLFVQPAASDRGLPFGCALYGASQTGKRFGELGHVFLCGPQYQQPEIAETLALSGYRYRETPDPAAFAAERISQGKIVGWFQGRSEFGPRALGHRSILADPRSASMKDRINARVKFREEFRPFAPAVTEQAAARFFSMGIMQRSPFMTVAVPVHENRRGDIQAVTHINGTARVQTVSTSDDALFHGLIENFGKLTGVPVVLNTSFNVRGQPIVESPYDAIATFAGSGIDALVIENLVVEK